MSCIPEKCHKCKERTFAIQLLATVLLTALKLYVGVIGGSRALVANSLQSASNIAPALALFASRKWSGRPEDQDHPYGYGKLEFIVSGVVGTVIVIFGIYLLTGSLCPLWRLTSSIVPSLSTLVAALISLLVNELLYFYLRCVDERFDSVVMRQNSRAVRIDSLASVAVIFAVIGARLGFPHLDELVGIVIVAVVVIRGAKCVIEAVDGLMDRSVPFDLQRKIINEAEKVDQVKVKGLRARFVGAKVWANLDLALDEQLSNNLTIEEFDRLARTVQKNVLRSNKLIAKVFVGFNPC